MLANTARGLQAVHAWHLYVHQHSVKTLLCQLIERFLTAGGQYNLCACPLQQLGCHLLVGLTVVNQQQPQSLQLR